MVNCIFFIAAFILTTAGISEPLIILPASLSVILCVFQFCLFVYNICHIILICTSFRKKIGNRQVIGGRMGGVQGSGPPLFSIFALKNIILF